MLSRVTLALARKKLAAHAFQSTRLSACMNAVERGLCAMMHTDETVQPGKLQTASEADTTRVIVKPRFDYKSIRANADQIRTNMKNRNYTNVDVDRVIQLIDARSNSLAPIQNLRTRRKLVSDAVSKLKATLVRMKKEAGQKGESTQQSSASSPSAPLKAGDIIPGLAADIANMTEAELVQEGTRIKDELARLESEQDQILKELDQLAFKLPNDTHPMVPIGDESMANLLAHVNPSVGTLEAFREAGFVPKDHLELANQHGLIDLDTASNVTGSRFYYLLREAALMELALIQWTVSKLVSRGFTPVLPPDLARLQVIEGAGFQSRDERSLGHHIYHIQGHDTALSATAEIPLAGLYMNKILQEAELPQKLVAFNHCFRTEIGGLGVQSKGIYRVHQFSKVEMFVVCTPEQGDALHEELIQIERELFTELGLNFKVLDMPTGDLGAPAYRKVDMEALMPGRSLIVHASASAIANQANDGKKKKRAGDTEPETVAFSTRGFSVDDLGKVKPTYGEISSTSNCTDYQARRLNIRYRPSQSKSGASEAGEEIADPSAASGSATGPATRFAYTLNGTACAVPRMLVAIWEQFQQPDGTIRIPKPLQPYLMGQEVIPFLPRK